MHDDTQATPVVAPEETAEETATPIETEQVVEEEMEKEGVTIESPEQE
jgi:hypothetical protein